MGLSYTEQREPIIRSLSIFRYFSGEKGQFQTTLARFGKDKTTRGLT